MGDTYNIGSLVVQVEPKQNSCSVGGKAFLLGAVDKENPLFEKPLDEKSLGGWDSKELRSKWFCISWELIKRAAKFVGVIKSILYFVGLLFTGLVWFWDSLEKWWTGQ